MNFAFGVKVIIPAFLFQQKDEVVRNKFMVSGVDSDAKQEIINNLTNLGAVVSEISSYDPSSTHLVCPKPSRNEKTLACMAAGKWILHTSYVTESHKANKLLDVCRLLPMLIFLLKPTLGFRKNFLNMEIQKLLAIFL